MKVTPLSLTGEAGETGRLVTGAAEFYAKFLKLQHEICWHHQLPLSRGLDQAAIEPIGCEIRPNGKGLPRRLLVLTRAVTRWVVKMDIQIRRHFNATKA